MTVTRRTVARGMAWSAPAVLATAAVPGYAASQPCAPGPVTVPFGGGTRKVLSTGASGMPSKLQWTYLDSTTGVLVTVTATAISDTILGRRTAYATNSYVDTDLTNVNGLNFENVTRSGSSPGTGGEGQDVVISFSRQGAAVAVTNLKAVLDDVDTKSGNWTDGVILNTTGVTAAVGSNIDGSGSSGTTGNVTSGPWHASSAGNGNNDPADRITLSGSSLNSLSLRLFNLPRTQIDGPSAGTNSDQSVVLSSLTFNAPGC